MGKSRAKETALRFTHLRLENWRNFTQVDLDLQQRAFFVGPNASGKSNLLDVFRFLHDIVSEGGGFREAVKRRGGVSAIRALAARRNPEVGVKVCMGDEQEPGRWAYELRFKQDNRQRPLIHKEIAFAGEERVLDRPDSEDERDPERLTQTYLEQVHANRKFRAVSDFFGTVQYLHIVPQLIREPERSVGHVNDPFGGDFLEQVAKVNERTRNAWLMRIRGALQVAVPQLKELELIRDNRGTPHLRGKYSHWRPQGAWQTEERFSDGTLRMLGLLWIVLSGKGPLLLEEPELSLHPEVIRNLPGMFWRMQRRTGRQVLLSTHAPDLLRDESIGLDEVLLLEPRKEGTIVQPAARFKDIPALLDEGVPLSEAVLPKTKPDDASQLSLFGD